MIDMIRDVNEAGESETQAEARTLEAEAKAWALEAKSEARTLEAEAWALEAEAWPLEAEAEARTLEAEAEALEAKAEAWILETECILFNISHSQMQIDQINFMILFIYRSNNCPYIPMSVQLCSVSLSNYISLKCQCGLTSQKK